MRTGYFWPIYGERDEVCFPFSPSRGTEHVRTALGVMPGANRVLLTDGYAAYEKYAKKLEITHSQCWVHCRRSFFEALQADPWGRGSGSQSDRSALQDRGSDAGAELEW